MQHSGLHHTIYTKYITDGQLKLQALEYSKCCAHSVSHEHTVTQVFFFHTARMRICLQNAGQHAEWRRLHCATWRINRDPTVHTWVSWLQHTMRHRS